MLLQLGRFKAQKKQEEELARTREQRRQHLMAVLQPALGALGLPAAAAAGGVDAVACVTAADGGAFDQNQPALQLQDQTVQLVAAQEELDHPDVAPAVQEGESGVLVGGSGEEQLPMDNGWGDHTVPYQGQEHQEQQQQGSSLDQQQQALQPLQVPVGVQGLQDIGGAGGSAGGTPSTAGRSSIVGRGGSLTFGAWHTSGGGADGEQFGGEEGEELVPAAAYTKLQSKYLQAKEKFEEMKRVSAGRPGGGWFSAVRKLAACASTIACVAS